MGGCQHFMDMVSECIQIDHNGSSSAFFITPLLPIVADGGPDLFPQHETNWYCY